MDRLSRQRTVVSVGGCLVRGPGPVEASVGCCCRWLRGIQMGRDEEESESESESCDVEALLIHFLCHCP